jgi:TetR/AcrR family transcriptional repressor of nem operon
VADAVGIDHSTLHHHVATKQELIGAVAELATRRCWSTMPDDHDPTARLHGHLTALHRMISEQPELFVVTAKLDLRARRDPAVRVMMDRFEQGWHQSLHDMLARGVEAGAWRPGAGVDATVELVIAVAKGTRLAPEAAIAASDQLERLLATGGT